MKVRPSVKRICEKCRVIKRHGRVMVICVNPNTNKDKDKKKKDMVRILGNNLSNKKKMYIALTAIYGIGINTSKTILKRLNIDPDCKAPDLSENDIAALRELLETDEFQLEGDLKRVIRA